MVFPLALVNNYYDRCDLLMKTDQDEEESIGPFSKNKKKGFYFHANVILKPKIASSVKHENSMQINRLHQDVFMIINLRLL